MKEKGFAPILIVILIAITSVIGGYLIYQKQFKLVSPQAQPTSTPAPTSKSESSSSAKTVYTEGTRSANWKTYTNIKYGISLKYPQNLQIEERKIQDYEVVSFASEYKPPFSNYLDVGLLIYNTSDKVDLRSWVDKWVIQDLPTGKKGSIVSGDITLYRTNQLEGLTFIGGKESENKYVFFKQGTKICGFQLSGSGTGVSYKENPNGEHIFDQIISTFKVN